MCPCPSVSCYPRRRRSKAADQASVWATLCHSSGQPASPPGVGMVRTRSALELEIALERKLTGDRVVCLNSKVLFTKDTPSPTLGDLSPGNCIHRHTLAPLPESHCWGFLRDIIRVTSLWASPENSFPWPGFPVIRSPHPLGNDLSRVGTNSHARQFSDFLLVFLTPKIIWDHNFCLTRMNSFIYSDREC